MSNSSSSLTYSEGVKDTCDDNGDEPNFGVNSFTFHTAQSHLQREEGRSVREGRELHAAGEATTNTSWSRHTSKGRTVSAEDDYGADAGGAGEDDQPASIFAGFSIDGITNVAPEPASSSARDASSRAEQSHLDDSSFRSAHPRMFEERERRMAARKAVASDSFAAAGEGARVQRHGASGRASSAAEAERRVNDNDLLAPSRHNVTPLTGSHSSAAPRSGRAPSAAGSRRQVSDLLASRHNVTPLTGSHSSAAPRRGRASSAAKAKQQVNDSLAPSRHHTNPLTGSHDSAAPRTRPSSPSDHSEAAPQTPMSEFASVLGISKGEAAAQYSSPDMQSHAYSPNAETVSTITGPGDGTDDYDDLPLCNVCLEPCNTEGDMIKKILVNTGSHQSYQTVCLCESCLSSCPRVLNDGIMAEAEAGQWLICHGNSHNPGRPWAPTVMIVPCNKYGCRENICDADDHCNDHLMIAGERTTRPGDCCGAGIVLGEAGRADVYEQCGSGGHVVCVLDMQCFCELCLRECEVTTIRSLVPVMGQNDLVEGILDEKLALAHTARYGIVRSIITPEEAERHCRLNLWCKGVDGESRCGHVPVCTIHAPRGSTTTCCERCLAVIALEWGYKVVPLDIGGHGEYKHVLSTVILDTLAKRHVDPTNPRQLHRCSGPCGNQFDRRYHNACPMRGCLGKLCSTCGKGHVKCRWPHDVDHDVLPCGQCHRPISTTEVHKGCRVCDKLVCIECTACNGCYTTRHGADDAAEQAAARARDDVLMMSRRETQRSGYDEARAMLVAMEERAADGGIDVAGGGPDTISVCSTPSDGNTGVESGSTHSASDPAADGPTIEAEEGSSLHRDLSQVSQQELLTALAAIRRADRDSQRLPPLHVELGTGLRSLHAPSKASMASPTRPCPSTATSSQPKRRKGMSKGLPSGVTGRAERHSRHALTPDASKESAGDDSEIVFVPGVGGMTLGSIQRMHSSLPAYEHDNGVPRVRNGKLVLLSRDVAGVADVTLNQPGGAMVVARAAGAPGGDDGHETKCAFCHVNIPLGAGSGTCAFQDCALALCDKPGCILCGQHYGLLHEEATCAYCHVIIPPGADSGTCAFQDCQRLLCGKPGCMLCDQHHSVLLLSRGGVTEPRCPRVMCDCCDEDISNEVSMLVCSVKDCDKRLCAQCLLCKAHSTQHTSGRTIRAARDNGDGNGGSDRGGDDMFNSQLTRFKDADAGGVGGFDAKSSFSDDTLNVRALATAEGIDSYDPDAWRSITRNPRSGVLTKVQYVYTREERLQSTLNRLNTFAEDLNQLATERDELMGDDRRLIHARAEARARRKRDPNFNFVMAMEELDEAGVKVRSQLDRNEKATKDVQQCIYTVHVDRYGLPITTKIEPKTTLALADRKKIKLPAGINGESSTSVASTFMDLLVTLHTTFTMHMWVLAVFLREMMEDRLNEHRFRPTAVGDIHKADSMLFNYPALRSYYIQQCEALALFFAALNYSLHQRMFTEVLTNVTVDGLHTIETVATEADGGMMTAWILH